MDYTKISDQLVSGYIVERTAKRMKQSFAKILLKTDSQITVDQWVILEQLLMTDGISQYQLAQLTFKDPPTITRIIDLLVNKGLVIRAINTDDRRKFKIEMTAVGKKTALYVKKVAFKFRKNMYLGLSDGEVKKLKEILDIINNNL